MKVICIDDERLALEFMVHMLNEMEGISVIETFQQPVEALEFITNGNEHVDVVFIDIHMPDMNGIELAEKILEKKPHINIVFVTAYNDYAVNAFELNALDYLLKPVKKERLMKTIDRLKSKLNQVYPNVKKEEQLHIRLGMNLSFSLGNEEFKPLKWRTAKARELFLYLLQNNNALIHKGTIMELLWGETEIDKGYSILYTTVYNVRKAIQAYPDHLELRNTNDGYMLRLHNVEIDLYTWESTIQQLPELNEQTIEEYIKTMDLNSGPYLADYDYIWIEAEKQRLENLWLRVAQEVVNYYKHKDQLIEAADWCKKIVERVPEVDDGHFSLMKLYAKLGRHDLVNREYETYVEIQQSLGSGLEQKVIDWYINYK